MLGNLIEIIRPLGVLAIALLLVLSVASSALARVAAIETTAPLQDYSEQSIEVAVAQAIQTAVRGAVAMGLPWVHLRRAWVIGDTVAVQILATDTEPEEEKSAEPEPGEEPGVESGDTGRLRL